MRGGWVERLPKRGRYRLTEPWPVQIHFETTKTCFTLSFSLYQMLKLTINIGDSLTHAMPE